MAQRDPLRTKSMRQDQNTTFGSLWLFCAIAFGWTWAFWGPISLHENGIIQMPSALSWVLMDGKPAAWGPLIAAIVVAYKRGGVHAIRGLFSRMTRFKFSARWYLLSLFLIPAIVGTAQAVAFVTGSQIPPSEAFENPISIPIAFVWIFFFGGPLQEEAGWRGTMGPAFQAKLGALVASLVTGVFWALWHLPLFYQPRAEIYYNQPFWGLLASTMLLSVLLTWVYNNTGRSLFAAMLMHASWNWANYLFPALQTDTGGLAFLILMACTVLIIVLRYGSRDLARTSQNSHAS